MPREDASGLGLLCVVAALGNAVRAARKDKADNAGVIGGENSLGNELAAQMKLVADDVTVIVLPKTGHWILEERPKETTDALLEFL